MSTNEGQIVYEAVSTGPYHCLEGGSFAGKTLKFTFEMATHPTVGRKSSARDLRPIVNPPIVRLKISQLINGEYVIFDEESYRMVDTQDFVCSATLCNSYVPPVPQTPAQREVSESSTPTTHSPSADPPLRSHYVLVTAESSDENTSSFRDSFDMQPSSSQADETGTSYQMATDREIITNILGDRHIGSRCWRDLDGTLGLFFVFRVVSLRAIPFAASPAQRSILLFSVAICLSFIPKQQLGVRTVGDYALRFDMFNLAITLSGWIEGSFPVLASCFSNTFTVYQPRTFPGAPLQDELLQSFHRQDHKPYHRIDEPMI